MGSFFSVVTEVQSGVVERVSLANSELATLASFQCSDIHHCPRDYCVNTDTVYSRFSRHSARLSRCELWWRLYRVPVVAVVRRFVGTNTSSFQDVICGAVKTKKMKTHCFYVSEILPSSHSKQQDAKTILIQVSPPPAWSIFFLISLSGLLLIKTETSLAQRFLP